MKINNQFKEHKNETDVKEIEQVRLIGVTATCELIGYIV